MPKPEKSKTERVDVLLVARGLAPSRGRAQALIMAGVVVVGENAAKKPGQRIDVDAPIRLKGDPNPFVSRGGLKLDGALRIFSVAVADQVAVDLGASTGGFTDCLLQRGARKVYALDVGHSQLDYRIRQDARVVVHEHINARETKAVLALIPEPCDLAVIDVSFISLRHILPTALQVLRPGGAVVALVKPQFEASRDQVGRGGIVRDETVRRETVRQVRAECERLGYVIQGECESPLPGTAGNVEYFLWLRSPSA